MARLAMQYKLVQNMMQTTSLQELLMVALNYKAEQGKTQQVNGALAYAWLSF